MTVGRATYAELPAPRYAWVRCLGWQTVTATRFAGRPASKLPVYPPRQPRPGECPHL